MCEGGDGLLTLEYVCPTLLHVGFRMPAVVPGHIWGVLILLSSVTALDVKCTLLSSLVHADLGSAVRRMAWSVTGFRQLYKNLDFEHLKGSDVFSPNVPSCKLSIAL